MNLGRSQIPDLELLRAFECAARHNSFTHAAVELSLTQSAVSRQIRMLEAQLGVVLFDRIRKRVVLSSSGEAILPDIVKLLRQVEDVVLRAKATGDGKKVLTVATLPTFGSRWLIRRLPAFLEANPNVSINVVSRTEPFDFHEEDIDLAIHYGQPVWANATCSYLCGETIVPVVSPGLVRKCPVKHASDLADAPLLHLATRPSLWVDWFRANDGDNIPALHGNRFDQFSMIIEAAVAGIGFGLIPEYLIEGEIASGLLVTAIDLPLSTSNGYYTVMADGRRNAATARAFQSWLLSQVGAVVTR
ncbi:LysR family transcriptional regulator (plasmid) [Agrobacterium leguminum]|uniref:HTH-type transcriptional regulator TtuA n=1 Tax=Agrobacterium deltaense NCPPB 1641 TaxID=1183425 RepID=A0A1S7UB20_9HYPH|nr:MULTISPECIES: LysR family transcriptional regulator [Agrobacterium]WFS69616.1 LysR family transcriptional regulator [Agrobacterium leguminum]CVI63568.1 Transcriptional regulator, LysR family [Agrobacterium deltaense NCPPB 1641]